ncbi:predicted protein [Nematostella vectensis]|uniref:DNA polymerase zeta catalytic subunit n=1 Tax=Nematostella vectensis TaxID=45351 RepID=A7S2K2_NEMVE|nr:predicted protein [Nematostella vectensis]|eukprot:XP_001634120.1 predicted protein [Nematostella vectensis]
MFSVRIVNADFYTAAPIPGLDLTYSSFRESKIQKVPLVRIFGATKQGQKTCAHVHGAFPYIYVPYDGTEPRDKYLRQFATSVDFAVHVSLGRASSSTHHVYDISIIKGRPFYGYHEEETEFIKISFYNPFLVNRVVELLQSGAIMNKTFQPHEAHIPYLLQFFMDYNLYGMNFLNASSVKFRFPVRQLPGWYIRAQKILFLANIGSNPGLTTIWEDERERRKASQDGTPLELPPSQDRGYLPDHEAELHYKAKLRQILQEHELLL